MPWDGSVWQPNENPAKQRGGVGKHAALMAGRAGAYRRALPWARSCILRRGFLVVDMLASDRIKFLDQHLLGHVALVFGGGVEMTGAGGGFQLDLFANAFSHDELLVNGCGWLRPVRRGRADRPGRRRCRSYRW